MREERYGVLFALFLTGAAEAYIGPGAGISVIGSILGLLATIVLAIGAVLIWPVRRLLRRRRAAKQDSDAGTQPNP